MTSRLQHLYDNNKSYGDLLVAARVAEADIAKPKHSVKVNQTVSNDPMISKLDELMKQLKSFKTKLSQVENKQKSLPSKPNTNQEQSQTAAAPQSSQRNLNYFCGTCYKCKGYGHRIKDCPLN